MMKSRKMFLSLIMLLMIFAGTGCSLTGIFSDNAQNAPSGSVLFEDDFSNPDSGWDALSDEQVVMGYRDGGFRFLVNQPYYDYWSLPGKRFTDSRIEVDSVKLSGPDDNDFGLICRYGGPDKFYAFIISSDGYFAIQRSVEGGDGYEVLGSTTLQYSDKINQGIALNQLRADCVGSTLTLYVNGEKLIEVRDDVLEAGEIGIIAGTNGSTGVDIFFDNFIVYQP
jgi:hypothetical protein